LSERSIVSLC